MRETTPIPRRVVYGHALQREGAAYDLEHGLWDPGVTEGAAVCQCGAMSGPLPTFRARKKWHREHKAEAAENLPRRRR